MKLFLIILAVAVVAAVVAFLLGPRDKVQPFTAFDADSLGDDIEAEIARSEARFPDIREGLHKEIIWHDPAAKTRTPIAIVYIHGFSASKSETRPLPDMVADGLNANIFYTRLAGHGRPGTALAGVRANDWLDDTAEALAIGRRIGEKVIVIGTSTGATASAFGALEPSMRRNVAGMAFISPNFGVQAAGSEFLNMPWGRILVPLLMGRDRDFTGDNKAYNHSWTTSYPMVSLIPMMTLVQHVRDMSFAEADVPLLMLHAPDDKVVQPEQSRKIFDQWRGPKTWIDVPGTRGSTHHVIAGDIVNPDMTDALAAKMIDWARSLPE